MVTEGGSEEALWIDTGRVADFGRSGADGGPVIRPLEAGDGAPGSAGVKADKDASGANAAPVSPLFIDVAGQPRALPGGVIVGLKEALSEPQARLQLEAAGLVPLRSIGARMWLVDSPAGMESLHLADRLNADGRFDFVEPNWWRPRSTK